MLAAARKRFAGERGVSFEASDYTQALPAGSFDAIVSALSIHHLEDPEKAQLFQRICRAAGFAEVQCVYQNQKFAVILARK